MKADFLQEKAVETTEQKGKRREKIHMPKPEEHGGMPQDQHCPLHIFTWFTESLVHSFGGR
jgi:hypothetical protein